MIATLAMRTWPVLTRTMRTRTMLTRTMPTTTVAGPVGRRRPRGAHPLGVHSVHDSVELFDDPIEAAGRIVAFGGPLGNRSVLGSPCEMHPTRHGSQHHHAPSHGQPFPRAIHRGFS
jgi:hypothetical protein